MIIFLSEITIQSLNFPLTASFIHSFPSPPPKIQESLPIFCICAHTMSKKKLCMPLSTFLRRSLTSFPQHFTSNFSQIKLSLHDSSLPFAPPSHNPTCDYYYSLGFFRKSLCSKSAEEIQRGCWNCHTVPHSEPFLVCESCRCIQPVDSSVDYFDIFGV